MEEDGTQSVVQCTEYRCRTSDGKAHHCPASIPVYDTAHIGLVQRTTATSGARYTRTGQSLWFDLFVTTWEE